MASAKSRGVKSDRLACAESIDERDRENVGRAVVIYKMKSQQTGEVANSPLG